MSVLTLGAVLVFLHPPGSSGYLEDTKLSYMFHLIALIIALAAIYLPEIIFKPVKIEEVEADLLTKTLMEKDFPKYMVGLALADSIAVLGFVIGHLNENSKLYLAFALVALAIIYKKYKNQDSLEDSRGLL